MTAYELVLEEYRESFGNLRKSREKTYVEFAYDKAECFERWVTSKNVDRGYEKLKELILVEELKSCNVM